MDSAIIRLPYSLAEELGREAESNGQGLDEYVLELLLLCKNRTREERVHAYIEAALSLIAEAWKELTNDCIRRAAENAWRAAVLAVKAYAAWKEGNMLRSYGNVWDYARKLAKELGESFYNAWMHAVSAYACSRELWCTPEQLEDTLNNLYRLIDMIENTITSNT